MSSTQGELIFEWCEVGATEGAEYSTELRGGGVEVLISVLSGGSKDCR